MLFSDLHLSDPILRAVAAEGYTTPTPVQAQAIPHVLVGRDVLGCAQTGTGKTAAFALPILHRLAAAPTVGGNGSGEAVRGPDETSRPSPRSPFAHSAAPGHRGHPGNDRHPAHSRGFEAAGHGAKASRRARCLVLCPTRELAHQIGESFRVYGRNVGMRQAVIYGGVGQNPQVDALRRGSEIIVATPGRLLDLMEQGHVDLRGIETLVLDEADRMLDMGFIDDIRKIVAHVPAQRQTLLFSATMPAEIRRLADSLLRNPVSVQVAPPAATADGIDQSVYFVDRGNKSALLAHLLATQSMNRVLVFTRTKHGADRVVRHLHTQGIRAEAIHSNKSQNARQRALDGFRSNKTHVLVATDIASRGIDVDGITHVVNYDLSHEPETYIHRIGRTARAGALGAAVAFCDREEKGLLKAIERLIRREIPVKTHDLAFKPAPAHSSAPTGGHGYRSQGHAPSTHRTGHTSHATPTHTSSGGHGAASVSRPSGGDHAPKRHGPFAKSYGHASGGMRRRTKHRF